MTLSNVKGIRKKGFDNIEMTMTIIMKKPINELIKDVKVNPYYDISTAELDEIYKMSADKVELITNSFLFGYLQGTKAEKSRVKKTRKG